MESRASVARKIKVRSLPKINLDIYSMIALNNLVVYAVHFLQEREVTATVEEVVSICFRLFPQSFALKNYSRWPDSALVIRRLNDGREKGNLKGNSMDGFLVKYKGKQLAKKVAKALGLVKPTKAKVKPTKAISQKKISIAPVIKQSTKRRLTKPLTRSIKAKQEILPLIKKVVKKPPSSEKRKNIVQRPEKTVIAEKIIAPQVSKEEKAKAGKFVHSMERSDAYVHYKKNGKSSKIGEFDFRSMLLCTMESSRETLIKNINLFKGYAGIHNRQDLITFLSYCEDRFSYLLAAPQKQLKKPLRNQGTKERKFHG